LNYQERNAVLKAIDICLTDESTFRTSHGSISREEVIAMVSSSLIEIGAHTHTHPQLSALSKNEQFHEIKTSQEVIEKLIGKKVALFSYPFGSKTDYTAESINICKELGFEACCATFSGQVRINSDLYQLPRFVVRNWDINSFNKRLGFFFYK
jgi:peptidoglycan/xylan/chitin deacetylase (PgdA/CDA1 family)